MWVCVTERDRQTERERQGETLLSLFNYRSLCLLFSAVIMCVWSALDFLVVYKY